MQVVDFVAVVQLSNLSTGFPKNILEALTSVAPTYSYYSMISFNKVGQVGQVGQTLDFIGLFLLSNLRPTCPTSEPLFFTPSHRC